MSESAEPVLSAQELERLCDFLYRRTGMLFGENKRYYIDRRIAERMRATGDADFRAYFGRLRGEAGELEQAINAFTVNETYFYREDYQFACMSRELLPQLVKGREAGSRVRILSAPCSTGEEPYSIAFFLLEHFARIDEFEVEIVASDIDTVALDRARAGVYNSRSLQYVPASTVARFTTDAGNGERRVIEALRDSIKFTNVNLIDAGEDRAYRAFDVVFCRNLLIYFDDVSRREAAATLFTTMSPGGFVCLGHSESMSRISSLFELRKFPEGIVYQKPF